MDAPSRIGDWLACSVTLFGGSNSGNFAPSACCRKSTLVAGGIGDEPGVSQTNLSGTHKFESAKADKLENTKQAALHLLLPKTNWDRHVRVDLLPVLHPWGKRMEPPGIDHGVA